MVQVDPDTLEEVERIKPPYQQPGEPILKTKLFIPPIRDRRVARPALVGRISAGLDKALILISAPAGFGKTTLLAEWAAQAALPVAWLSLDDADNDPNRFLRYVLAALSNALPEPEPASFAAAQAMLQALQPPPLQTILVALINDLTDLAQPLVLVLDDYQWITSPALNETLAFLLERLPRQMHLIIATRADPALPLHRLRAAQHLLEIRMDELRFSGEEAGAFMNTVMGLDLAEQDISTLAERTEGWIVGLQMSALSMQGIADRPAFVRALNGSNRYILEYLIEEVLDRQPVKIQAFLLQTSILDRLCAPLCQAVLAEQADCQEVLDYLHRSNIFLTPLDEAGTWYRYHQLFADLLQARLQRASPNALPQLHLRSSQWYESAGLPEQAIRHAFAGKDLERTARLAERWALEIMGRGEMAALLRLFEALPGEVMLSRPALGAFHGWSLVISGQLDRAEARLRQVEGLILTGEQGHAAREVLGSIAAYRGLMADYRGDLVSAMALARQADELLPEGQPAARSLIPFVLGDGYTAAGELDQAEQAFEQFKTMGQASGSLWTVSLALHKLALVKKLRGRLHDAESLYREAIQYAGERGGQRYGSLGATYVGLSDLLREQNELEAARQMASQALEDMGHWQSPTDLVNGYLTRARIALAQGDIELAQASIGQAKELARPESIFPINRANLEAGQVRLWLARGDLASANRWLEGKHITRKGPGPDPAPDFVGEIVWISASRVYIAQNELELALELLTRLAQGAESAGWIGRLIEILALLALVLHRLGKKDRALNALQRSLTLAEPQGYLRVYLDEGQEMEALLQACSRSTAGSLKAYADRLLQAFRAESGHTNISSTATGRPEALAETLTEREVEVLQLLAAGFSNQEIAERFVVSEGTVKTHTHNLYGKLGVRSRTQAIARANELKLI